MTISAIEAAKLLEGTTPGPWQADGPPYNRIVWSSADNRVCFMAHTNGLDNARDDATSNLVAAAPDLAAALIASEAARKLAEERLAKVKAAFRVNMLRVDPTISHEAIDAILKEIDNG